MENITVPQSHRLSVTNKELGGGGPQERDWRGIGTALLVILVICSLIGVAVFIFTPLSGNRDFDLHLPKMTELNLMVPPLDFYLWKDDNIILYKYWLDHKNLTNRKLTQEILQHDVRTNKTEVFMGADVLAESTGNFGKITLSSDCNYVAKRRVVAATPSTPDDLRYKFEIMHKDRKEVIQVGVKKTAKEVQQFFLWGPVKGRNDYAFVQNGQIYYSEKPENAQPIRITDGNNDKVNGLLDWVYAEEIFSSKQGMWWSPSGSQLAFTTYSPDDMQSITMTAYVKGKSYPVESSFPYPKSAPEVASPQFPRYTLSLWDKERRQAREMDVMLRNSSEFRYLFSVEWVRLHGREVAIATWANRYQNEISITVCQFMVERCSLIYEYTYPKNQWAMPIDFMNIQYSDDSIFVVLPRPKSDGNMYNHIVKLTISDRDFSSSHPKETALSIGNFDVKQMVKYDHEKKLIYFFAKAPKPGDSHLYATSTNVSPDNSVCKCVTCFYSNCTYQRDIQFSPVGNRLVVPCKGPGLPVNYMAIVNGAEIAKISPVMNQEEYINRTSKVLLPTLIDDEIVIEGNYTARVKIWLPHEQQRGARALPVMLHVYGGPGWQSVTEEFKYPIEKWFCLNRTMVLIDIDARGSGGRGWKYQSPVYGALGTIEMQDQVTVMQKLAAKYSFIDKSRITVFGWSYGGFASTNMVEMAPEKFFRCAISVAPVSNFLYYDSTYTERYMGDATRADYQRSDITRNVTKFGSTRLLLVHGLYDDNVHFQNSAIFIEELQRKNIDFDLMVYPNQDHSISVTRPHLYQRMYNFLDNCVN